MPNGVKPSVSMLVDVSQKYANTGIGKYSSYLRQEIRRLGGIKVHNALPNKKLGLPVSDFYIMLLSLFNELIFPEERFLFLALISRRRHLVVIHDMRWMKDNDKKSRILRSGFHQACRKGWRFIAASPVVERELASCSGIQQPISSLFNCVDGAAIRKEIMGAAGQPEDVHLLYVGSFEPRKNVHELFNFALQNSRVRLTVVCSEFYWANRSSTVDVESMIRKLGSRVSIRVGLSDNDLLHEYVKAHAYISLSDYEGFGRPLIEAQSVGLPVIAKANYCSDVITGGHYIPYDRFDNFYDMMDALFNQYSSLQVAGFNNAMKYSMSKFRKQALSIFS